MVRFEFKFYGRCSAVLISVANTRNTIELLSGHLIEQKDRLSSVDFWFLFVGMKLFV